MSSQTEPRLAHHGSCHCGHTKYIAFISMPPAPPTVPREEIHKRLRFYKCNCTPCHKTGYFHMRLPDPANDFYILSPLDLNNPSEMRNYMCNNNVLHWHFCPICGMRCFISEGCWKVDEVDLYNTGEKTKVLRLDMDAIREGQKQGYLSVNALTLDRGPEENGGKKIDLREVKDKGWLFYLDCKDEVGEPRVDYPHEGGTW